MQGPRATSSVPAVELQQLSLHYTLQGTAAGAQRVDVLRDVNLRIEAGQSLAVVGPSGSGKTSLLLLLSGLERPASGDVLLSGASLAALDADGLADLRREHVGIIFQSFHLLPSLTALDNVALPLQMAGQRDAHQRATALLQRVGLGARLHQWPATLSGGEQQRVAIARALVHRPQLLLADEPTGNLDDATGATVRELLFDLNREAGTTLVLVTHDLSFARRCQRVLRLHDGQLHEQAHEPAHEQSFEPSRGQSPKNAIAADASLSV